MKPCTNGPRHTWQWVKNQNTTSRNGTVIAFAARGLYRCACGAYRLGAANQNAPGGSLL